MTIQDTLLSRGYVDGTISVPSLQLDFSLDGNFYRKHPLVDDVKSAGMKIAEELDETEDLISLESDNPQTLLGLCLYHDHTPDEEEPLFSFDIFVKNIEKPLDVFVTDAHEHGHMIYMIDPKILYDQYNVSSALVEKVRDGEDFAYLSEMLAVKSAGIDLKIIFYHGVRDLKCLNRMLELAKLHL